MLSTVRTLAALLLFSATSMFGQSAVNPGGSVLIPGPGGGGGAVTSVNGQTGAVTISTSGSTRVVYATQLIGNAGDAIVAPGSTTYGTDRTAQLTAATAGGNVDLELEGQYSIGASIPLSSNTRIHCTVPGSGLILRPGTNAPMFVNAHPSGATTASGTGGFLVSNIVDHDITIDGQCVLNFNATNANSSSDHKTNGSSPLWIYGMRFLGVRNLTISGAHMYDSGTYSVAVNNLDGADYENNFLDHPDTSQVNTDGYHTNGPAQNITIRNTHARNVADDVIALNADDGYEASLGDPNFTHANYPGWVNGPITNVHIDGTYLENCYFAFRALSVTERIDNVYMNDTRGTLLGHGGMISNPYSSAPGNFGSFLVDGWNVVDNFTFSETYLAQWWLGGNIQNFQLNHVQELNLPLTYPIVQQFGGTIGNFGLHDWNIYNANGVDLPLLVKTNGIITNPSLSGLNWIANAAHVGSVFGGTAVPANLTVSNYSGPNRLLASGYAPVILNGDAFSNVYASSAFGTTYIFTTFNELGAGADVLSSQPAITSGEPGTGIPATWGYGGSPTVWQYQAGGGMLNVSGNHAVGAQIVPTDYVIRATVASSQSDGQQILFRWSAETDYIAVRMTSTALSIVNLTGGTTTTVATQACSCATGSVTITATGSSLTATMNGVTATGTDTNNATNKVIGWGSFNSTGVGMTLSSYRVSSL